MTTDYEFGKDLNRVFSYSGINMFRTMFRAILNESDNRLDKMPAVLRGWLDQYLSPDRRYFTSDIRFFKTLRKKHGLNLVESQALCTKCTGAGSIPLISKGVVTQHRIPCYFCKRTGTVTRWALS